jgi:hypothetical protein
VELFADAPGTASGGVEELNALFLLMFFSFWPRGQLAVARRSTGCRAALAGGDRR